MSRPLSEEQSGPRFPTRREVDFVVVGSGAAGGVFAKELATAGFDIVVLEQGPYMKAAEFKHDELAYGRMRKLTGSFEDYPSTFRKSENAKAGKHPVVSYAKLVGGSSVHFTANYWRFRPIDFKERSVLGPRSGTGFVDWPITYEELEPYYTKVDWEVGVSGAPGPFDPPRSRPYPMPPPSRKVFWGSSRGGRAAAGASCPARAHGHPFRRVQQPTALHALRVLYVFRLRVRIQILDTGFDDAPG